MGLFDIATGVLGGISSLGGLLGASAEKRRQQQAQQQALLDLSAQNDALYQNALATNGRTLMQQAGLGGDAIAALGRNLGDSLSGAGVYNSSAVAGALANAQAGQQANLADLATRLQSDAWQGRQQGILDIGRMRLGLAGQGLDYARQDYGNAQAGLSSFLGSLAQNNLMRSGANAYRPQTPPINGNAGRGTLPGNADYNAPPVIGNLRPFQAYSVEAAYGRRRANPYAALGVSGR